VVYNPVWTFRSKLSHCSGATVEPCLCIFWQAQVNTWLCTDQTSAEVWYWKHSHARDHTSANIDTN